jgi:photosystem II stability/assembly factor-like uncharacterized protein
MIYLGTESGLYRWTLSAPWPVYHSLQGLRVRAVLAGGEGRLTVVDDGGRLLETSNNGETWDAIDLPVGVSDSTAYALGGSPLTMLLASRPMGLFCRPHGSRWWTKLASPVGDEGTSQTVNALAITSGASPVLLASVVGGGLYRSTDGAKTWAKVAETPATIHTIRTVGSQVVLGTDQGVYLSTDSGATFAPAGKGLEAVPQVYCLDINPANPAWMLAGAAAASPVASKAAVRPQGFQFGLYETKDGGKTWAKVLKKGLPELIAFDTISDIRFDPGDPDNILMAQGSGECWLTKNGGDYWVVISRAIESARALAATA